MSTSLRGWAPLLLLLVACSKGQGTLSEEELAGEKFEVGAKVKAPLGKRKKQNASVMELYGKLAKLRFADHNIGWALVKELEPPGAIQYYPKEDRCEAKVGDRVRARWSTSRSLTGAVVDEVHGKLAHLKFDDNDEDWALCDELKPPADEEEDDESGGGGVSPAVVKCKRACNAQCRGASNKSKCVGQCRRACG